MGADEPSRGGTVGDRKVHLLIEAVYHAGKETL